MHRFQRISATLQTVNAQLFQFEEVIESRDNVGLYDGKEKTLAFDNGRLYLTTHRLIYIDESDPQRNSRYLDLHNIKQTEYWARFLKSSPKITLAFVGDAPDDKVETGFVNEEVHPSAETWPCHVCGYRNPSSGPSKCFLCGVTRLKDGRPATPSTPQSSVIGTPRSGSSEPPSLDPTETGNLIACPTCTYLNHPSMTRCELCESALGTYSPRPSSSAAPTPRPSTPASAAAAQPTFVRLSFRKGGDKAFYSALKQALLSKAWDSDKSRKSHQNGQKVTLNGQIAEHRTTTVGIEGLLRTIDIDARDRDDDMQEALSDLEALMIRAKEMVQLAQTLGNKVAEIDSKEVTDPNDNVHNVVNRSLASLGLGTPAVTLDMAKDEQEYHKQLARELAAVLLSKSKDNKIAAIMEDGPSSKGLLGLDEVWCIWNRARGIALVSPKDMKQACAFLPVHTQLSIRMHTFKGGLTVLHTPYYSREAFANRVRQYLELLPGEVDEVPSISEVEIALKELLSVSLAQQMMESVEDEAATLFVRDEGDAREGLRWQVNYFAELEKHAGAGVR